MQAHSTHRRALAASGAAVLATLALAGPAAAAIAPSPTSPSPTVSTDPVATSTQIIMRDGGICDPIRHMGC